MEITCAFVGFQILSRGMYASGLRIRLGQLDPTPLYVVHLALRMLTGCEHGRDPSIEKCPLGCVVILKLLECRVLDLGFRVASYVQSAECLPQISLLSRWVA